MPRPSTVIEASASGAGRAEGWVSLGRSICGVATTSSLLGNPAALAQPLRLQVGEPVADSRHGEDVARVPRVGFDLAPQVADVHVDDACLDRMLVAPHRAQDPLA